MSRVLCALLVAAGTGTAQAPRPTFAARAVQVTIRVDAGGRAAVRERFALLGDLPAGDYVMLNRPCAVSGPVRLRAFGSDVAWSKIDRAPWTVLRDSSGARRAQGDDSLAIDYEVSLSGREAGIPVVVPALMLQASGGYGAGAVRVDVVFDAPAGTGVILPQLRETGDGRWTGRFLALPSVVRVDLGPASDGVACNTPGVAPGDSGRFEFIFFSFLATIALWVPLYMWWVSRQHDPAASGRG